MQPLKLVSLAVFMGSLITGCNDNSSQSSMPAAKTAKSPVNQQLLFQGHSESTQLPADNPELIRSKAVNNQQDYVALWSTLQPAGSNAQTPPVVDFTQGQVVFIDAGIFSSGGYKLDLTSVDQQGDHALVTARLTHPAPDTLTTAVMWRPLIVAYIKTLQPIKFQYDEAVYANAQSLDSINHGGQAALSGSTEQVKVIQDKAALTAAAQSKYETLTAEATQAIEHVNFAQGQVILLDMGVFGTGGYSLTINPKIETADGKGDFKVTYHYSGKNCIVTMSFTNPYRFVYIPSKADINVVIEKQTTDCPR